MSKITPNQRTTLYGIDSIAGTPDYVTVTGKKLDVNASVSIGGSAIPISGATSAIVTAIVDGSGNQITSFGGGVEYTDGGTPPTHPVGKELVYNNAGTWAAVSVANPLPVSGSFSPPALQNVNLTQVASSAISQGHGTAATAIRVELPTDGTGIVGIAAGSAVIGHVIADSGSTTAVTQATASSLNATVVGTGTFVTQSILTTGSAQIGHLEANQSINNAQINGVTPLMGNGVTGTGSQRVTIASDNTAFSVNATLSAETTKVIGTVNQGTSPWVVGQSTASSLNATVVGTGTFVTQSTLAAETTKVIGVTRSADGSGNLLTSTANALDINIKSGNISGFATSTKQSDGSQKTQIVDGSGNVIASTSNALNTSDSVTSTVTPVDKTGSGSISALNGTVVATTNGCSIVSFNILGTWSATLLIEGTIDGGSNWIAIDGDVDATDTIINNTTTNGLITVNCASYGQVRLRANPYTSGTANITWSSNSGLSLVEVFNTNGNSLRVQDLASGTPGATAPTNAQIQGNLAKTSLPTAVSDGQLVNNMGDKFGRQVVLVNAVRDIVGSQTTTITSSTAETTIITQAASTFNDITAIFISNTSAAAARVDIRDTTGGSVIFQIYVPAGDMRGVSLSTPWPQTTVNTNWTAQSSASIADLRVSVSYVKNK